jgi:G3E family GTPase
VLYREAETGKRFVSSAQAIGILADVSIANLRWDQIVACDVVERSAWELICSINKLIVIVEERQNVLNSTLHIVEVMRASYPARCLLKLGINELQKARDVGGEHNRSSIHMSLAIIFMPSHFHPAHDLFLVSVRSAVPDPRPSPWNQKPVR